MMNRFRQHLESFALLLLLTCLFSLLFSVLYQLTWISYTTLHISSAIGGMLAYSAAGIWLGRGLKQHALLQVLAMTIPLAILAFLLHDGGWQAHLCMAGKLLLFFFSAMLGFLRYSRKHD